MGFRLGLGSVGVSRGGRVRRGVGFTLGLGFEWWVWVGWFLRGGVGGGG